MVGTAQPLCLSASETEGRRYDMTMNLGKSEITAPHYNAGLDDEMLSSRRRAVCLDIPFYRTVFSATGFRLRLALRQFQWNIRLLTQSHAKKQGSSSRLGAH
jgi:hypothetical protein